MTHTSIIIGLLAAQILVWFGRIVWENCQEQHNHAPLNDCDWFAADETEGNDL